MIFFDQENFIKRHITDRTTSYFQKDIDSHSSKLFAEINGKSILVIGGAGTIGSSFIKAILPFYPGKLTIVDYNENGLTELTRDLRSQYNKYIPEKYITYPFDFGGNIFAKFYKESSFDIVACFAAHKHVRSEKDHLAIEAMIRNNVFNTKSLLDLAVQNKPTHFFCVSTDKAANPVNVMGASKKVMEKVLLTYAERLKITTARFANVAFSNGSLLYGFIERIKKRQPLAAPTDVKRYFVSPEESGQLCMLACILGKSSDIFFPKLNEDQMLTFSIIAEAFLLELGLQPDYCKSEEEARKKMALWTPSQTTYPVCFFTTDTSGEKTYEEFFSNNDEVDMLTFSALGVVKNSVKNSMSSIDNMIHSFECIFQKDGIAKTDIISMLNNYLPDFNHIEAGKSLDQKM